LIVARQVRYAYLIRYVGWPLACLFAWDLVVTGAFLFLHRPWMDQPAPPLSLLGSALVLFVGIRNNTAYGRWWEARTLWGGVVNNARVFARQVRALLGSQPVLVRAVIAYAHLLRHTLRGDDVEPDLARLLPASVRAALPRQGSQPSALLAEIGCMAAAAARDTQLDGALLAAIDRCLSDLGQAQGGLERLRNTPLAMQYAAFPRLFVRIFCALLPLSMVQELGWLTPLGSTLVGFLFLALERIGADLEEPFAGTPHDVPMAALTRSIEIDLLQSLGADPPPPLAPVHGVLW
jgi:putative membrane protein